MTKYTPIICVESLDLLPTMQGFMALPELVFPVHLPLQLTSLPDQAEVTVFRAVAPMGPFGLPGA